jgi:hypothetical protein
MTGFTSEDLRPILGYGNQSPSKPVSLDELRSNVRSDFVGECCEGELNGVNPQAMSFLPLVATSTATFR